MKVFDCFPVFNELDLLELRLHELDPLVDYFVIVEATRSFQKKEKPLYFQQNRDRYSRFEKKIIYILVDRFPTFWKKWRPVTSWHYDNFQKEQVLKGLGLANDNDLILFSDLDEIPSAEALNKALRLPHNVAKIFEHYQAYYFLNNVCRRINDYEGRAVAQKNKNGFGFWRGAVLQPKSKIRSIKEMRCLRDQEGPHIFVVEQGGWHLSNMGGVQSIVTKMQSWAHTEYNNKNYASMEVIVDNILNGRDLLRTGEQYELLSLEDKHIPFLETLYKNPERWAHMIKTPEQLRQELAPLCNLENI